MMPDNQDEFVTRELELFRQFQQRRDAVGLLEFGGQSSPYPDTFNDKRDSTMLGIDPSLPDALNRTFGQHKGKILGNPARHGSPAGFDPAAPSSAPQFQAPGQSEPWSEYNGKPGMYRGNPVEYDRPNLNPALIGQPHGFIPKSGPMACQTSKPASPADAAMGRLDEQIGRLHATIRTLKSRLDPMLTPDDPSGGADNFGGPVSQRAKLTEEIYAHAGTVSNAIDMLDNILSRLDL